MTYRMFVDDERYPPDTTCWEGCVIVRNPTQFINAIVEHGVPEFISFDHDLGDDVGSGYDIAKLLIELDLSGAYKIPDNFHYYVHSQNPIGVANINGLLNGYLGDKNDY